MTQRALAIAALRKLPKRLLRAAIRRAGNRYDEPCFVTACASPSASDHTDTMWRRFARAYGLTWNGMYVSDDGSQVTALSAAWEYDQRWFRRALRRRLAA